MHSALYGSEEGPVEVEQILQGLVEPPREFLPLYTALHEMAGTAQVGGLPLPGAQFNRVRPAPVPACLRLCAPPEPVAVLHTFPFV